MPRTTHEVSTTEGAVGPSSGGDGVARRIVFFIPPTGAYCREDRCQSYFAPELIPTLRPPMEECEASGAVRDAGGKAFIVDAPAERLSDAAALAHVTANAPDHVILVVTFGSLDADLSWAARLKDALPSVTVGVRGAPCYALADRIMAERSVDFCVRGEYEIVFSDIVRSGFRRARGVTWRDNERIVENTPADFAPDLDALALPDRSGIRNELYTVRGLGRRQATVRVQRGCPYPCTYCLVHSVSGAKARHRSPDSIVSEIEALMRDGFEYFYLRAETFNLDRRWVLTLCAELEARCPGAKWVTTTRVESVDHEVLSAMRNAGCYGLSFGIDVASATIAEKVRKPLAPEAAAEALELCDRVGIVSLAYVMIGFAWETAATLREAETFLEGLKPDLLTVHYAHPYPGTVYFEQTEAARLRVASPHAQSRAAFAPPAVSLDELEACAARLRWRHYRRPSVAVSLLTKAARLLLREMQTRPKLRSLTAAPVASTSNRIAA